MGKFVTALLCLVANVYVVHSESDTSKIVTRMILKTDREIIAIYNIQSEIDEQLEYINANATTMKNTVNGSIISAIEEYEDRWNTLIASTRLDYFSCNVSWSDEYTKGEALVAEICDCITCYVTSAASAADEFDEYIEETAEFLLTKLQKIARSDDDEMFDFFSSVTFNGTTITREALLLNNVAAMGNKFAKTYSDFSYKALNCVNATAVIDFATTVKAYYIDAENCFTALESSSS
ncbi:uncharacterized protein LOC124404673 [Diprion similis]|uniref:uncharacterized protein LOC124404673 n=1 Tax=Diprion similis TaxID=362088 RepID=UPI001EF81F56|nr:uncharacterized protein LOC124404673 [Diprion similis]